MFFFLARGMGTELFISVQMHVNHSQAVHTDKVDSLVAPEVLFRKENSGIVAVTSIHSKSEFFYWFTLPIW